MQPVNIPIYTLSGGVSRQPDSKRTPFEAEELDNCMISLERSLEKRPGFTVLSGIGGYNLNFLPINVNPHFTWYQVDRTKRFLIIVDRNATIATSNLFYILFVDGDSWINQTPIYQWDAEDPDLVWNGTDTITVNDPRYTIYTKAEEILSPPTIAEYNDILSRGMVSRDTRRYIAYGLGDNTEILKTVQVGVNIIYANTRVKAGFTSGLSGKTVNLDGTETETDDVGGAKITYYTSAEVSRVEDDGRLYYDAAFPSGLTKDPNLTAQFIPVEDFIYGDFESPWLGQSVAGFNELRFPPDLNDWYVNNGNPDLTPDDYSARDMLIELYDEFTEYPDTIGGRGKIYYCAGPYLDLDAGYYRIVSFAEGLTSSHPSGSPEVGAGPPYTQKVRTPDYCSVLDKKRMPQKLSFENGEWTFQPINWEHREVGDRNTNPGPSPFLDADQDARHVEIKSICNFRDRLFMSCEDVVFSSRLGDIQNLWIKDPSNITTADPIDIRAASNSYSEISAMIPFNTYLFLNSRGNVQFELKGDSNLISPLTAEISSTTFYSTLDIVEPVTLGSQIYFFDKSRLFIYLNEDSREFNTAFEVSSPITGYLPENISEACVAAAQNYVMAVDGDDKSNLYVYCNRFSGNQVVQSAFWKYILSPSDEIFALQAWDNYLYVVVKRDTGSSLGWYLMRSILDSEDVTIPRLDSRTVIELSPSNTVSVGPLQFTIELPYKLPEGVASVVLGPDFENNQGEIYNVEEVTNIGSISSVTISGIDLTQHYGKHVYVGVNYTMLARLSRLYYRADQNNIIEGVLNLKTMTTRHSDTGSYRIEVTRRGRPTKLVTEFSATNLETEAYRAEDGILVSKIFSVSENCTIDIINDTPTPSNITQIEFRCIFNRKNSSKR
jgi:hypothetical protein